LPPFGGFFRGECPIQETGRLVIRKWIGKSLSEAALSAFLPFFISFVFGISKWGIPQKRDEPKNKGFLGFIYGRK